MTGAIRREAKTDLCSEIGMERLVYPERVGEWCQTRNRRDLVFENITS